MSSMCRECEAGLAHCHGTLILHSGARPDCTDPDCSYPELTIHTFVVDCDVVACECAQPIGSAWLSGTASG
jgi:hypothetical protein